MTFLKINTLDIPGFENKKVLKKPAASEIASEGKTTIKKKAVKKKTVKKVG